MPRGNGTSFNSSKQDKRRNIRSKWLFFLTQRLRIRSRVFAREFQAAPTLLPPLSSPASRFFHSRSQQPGFPPSWLRQMVCIYFTARQPVDFSFLHYASPLVKHFFVSTTLLLYSLSLFSHFFSPRDSFLVPSIHVSPPPSPSFSPSSYPSPLSSCSNGLIPPPPRPSRWLSFCPVVAPGTRFPAPRARFLRKNRSETATPRDRETSGEVMKEFGFAYRAGDFPDKG